MTDKMTEQEKQVLTSLAREDDVHQAFTNSQLDPQEWGAALRVLKSKGMVGGSLATQMVWLTEAGEEASGGPANGPEVQEWRARASQKIPARLEELRRGYAQEANPYQRLTKLGTYVKELERVYGWEQRLQTAELRKAADASLAKGRPDKSKRNKKKSFTPGPEFDPDKDNLGALCPECGDGNLRAVKGDPEWLECDNCESQYLKDLKQAGGDDSAGGDNELNESQREGVLELIADNADEIDSLDALVQHVARVMHFNRTARPKAYQEIRDLASGYKQSAAGATLRKDAPTDAEEGTLLDAAQEAVRGVISEAEGDPKWRLVESKAKEFLTKPTPANARGYLMAVRFSGAEPSKKAVRAWLQHVRSQSS